MSWRSMSNLFLEENVIANGFKGIESYRPCHSVEVAVLTFHFS